MDFLLSNDLHTTHASLLNASGMKLTFWAQRVRVAGIEHGEVNGLEHDLGPTHLPNEVGRFHV